MEINVSYNFLYVSKIQNPLLEQLSSRITSGIYNSDRPRNRPAFSNSEQIISRMNPLKTAKQGTFGDDSPVSGNIWKQFSPSASDKIVIGFSDCEDVDCSLTPLRHVFFLEESNARGTR